MLYGGPVPSRSADNDAVLRIGELSRRVGVTDHVLRAWERRYGLLRPVRTAAGYRLYSEADERRIRRMQVHLASGELSIKRTAAAIEQILIRRALQKTKGNRTRAADLLEISHRALLYKIKDYKITDL